MNDDIGGDGRADARVIPVWRSVCGTPRAASVRDNSPFDPALQVAVPTVGVLRSSTRRFRGGHSKPGSPPALLPQWDRKIGDPYEDTSAWLFTDLVDKGHLELEYGDQG